MHHTTTNRWLEILTFIVNLVRPKFHNIITRVVVIFGLTLSVESQVNVIEAFAVAIFEYFFGPSDVLRNIFSGHTNPWIGVFFVVFGLFYNALYSLGLEYMKSREFNHIKEPKLSFILLNSDKQQLDRRITLRGKLCNVPNENDIQDNDSYSEFALKRIEKQNSPFTFGHISGTSSPVSAFSIDPHNERINKDFYRERAKFLKTWGGAEILALSIENTGNVLCNNIRVEVSFPKKTGIDADNKNDLVPDLPSQETDSSLRILGASFRNKSHPYDITNSNNTDNYLFRWELGNLQAGESLISHTKIFLRTSESIELNIRIFCDEFSSPINLSYTLNPPLEVVDFTLKDISSERKQFRNIVDEVVMNGFLERYYDNFAREMEQDYNSNLPN